MNTLEVVLQNITAKLSPVSDSPRQEALEILSHVLKKDRNWLHTNHNKNIPHIVVKEAHTVANLVLSGKPLAYVIGEKFFYNHLFKVSKVTLIPRPETELLVDRVLEKIYELVKQKEKIELIEIGVGTGCVGISIISELLKNILTDSEVNFLFVDISKKALKVAKENCLEILENYLFKQEENVVQLKNNNMSVQVEFLEKDISSYSQKAKSFDIVISNPPYIPTSELKTLEEHVKKEPNIALDGGESGFEVVEKILALLSSQKINSTLLMEIHSTNLDELKNMIKKDFRNINCQIHKDLTGKDRILRGTKI